MKAKVAIEGIVAILTLLVFVPMVLIFGLAYLTCVLIMRLAELLVKLFIVFCFFGIPTVVVFKLLGWI